MSEESQGENGEENKVVVVSTEEYTNKALEKYGVTRAAIAELRDKYLPLKTAGIEDKVSYDIVRAARMDIKKLRVRVEKTRKDLKAEALEYGRKVDARAKDIFERLEPIETHLIEQEKLVDDERERIKNKAAEDEAARISELKKGLFDAGMSFNGVNYIYGDITVDPDSVSSMGMQEYVALLDRINIAKIKEREAQVERDRIAAEAAEKLTGEARENERIRKEQEAKQVELDAEQARIDAEKEKIEKDKQDAIDEAERVEEAKQAEIKAKENAAREEEERIRQEKEATELTERLKPDNEKLVGFASQLEAVSVPAVENGESHEVLKKAVDYINKASLVLRSAQ